jgi:uncharacterized membrane protein (DUF485 family)
MEDYKLKELFTNFQPEMSSSLLFMDKLQKNMERVEFLKQHNLAIKRRNRLAVCIAATSGFIMGVILTLLFPLVESWVSTFSISLPLLRIHNLTIGYIVGWIVMAAACIITALNAYEIAFIKLTPKGSIRM